jgi:hypothetical protein
VEGPPQMSGPRLMLAIIAGIILVGFAWALLNS